MKLTAIFEIFEKVPPQDVVCLRSTVVPASDRSLENIVNEVVPIFYSQAGVFADVNGTD